MAESVQLASTFEAWYDPYVVKAKWPKGKTLVDLFNEAVERTDKNRVAIVDGDRTFTFGELDEKVNKVRDHLLAHDIKPEDPVGLSFERCAEYIIGYLGTLRAQAAYMPIEEAWPAKQLTNVLSDSRAKVVLTKARNLHRYEGLELDYKVHIFCMDEGWENKVDKNENPPLEWVINPRSRAYFVYTSGSTGKPKGIICPHEGSVMAYKQRIDLYPYGENEREAVNIFFTWECIRPLIHGQTLYIIPDSHIYDPTLLVPWFHKNKITRVMMTPSAFQNCIDIPELFQENPCDSLTKLFF
jgi:non-ribosomal peptide synthetase component F